MVAIVAEISSHHNKERLVRWLSMSCDKLNTQLYELLCMLWFVIVVACALNDMQLMVCNVFVEFMCISKGDGLVCTAMYGEDRGLFDTLADLAHIMIEPLGHILQGSHKLN